MGRKIKKKESSLIYAHNYLLKWRNNIFYESPKLFYFYGTKFAKVFLEWF